MKQFERLKTVEQIRGEWERTVNGILADASALSRTALDKEKEFLLNLNDKV